MSFRATLTDFFIITLLISLILASFGFLYLILYSEEDFSGSLRIKTAPLPIEYGAEVKVGDDLYDHVTKRLIGKASTVELNDTGEGYCTLDILISNARGQPRGRAVRSAIVFLEIDGVYQV